MKRIFGILTAVALTASMVACNKEKIDDNGKTGIGGRISVSVSGLLGEYTPETKSELVNTVRVAWKDDDVVFVYDGTKNLGELTARIEDEEGRYAKLTGTINQPSGTTLYLLHGSSLSTAPAIEGGKVSVSLAEQSTDTAPFVVYSTLDCTDGQTSIKDLTVPFHFGTSVVRVSCSGLEPKTNVSRAEISDVNTYGYYWSSSRVKQYPNEAQRILINPDRASIQYIARYLGLSVRAVTD